MSDAESTSTAISERDGGGWFKWDGYDAKLIDGLAKWTFVEDTVPWLCPSEDGGGLGVVVTDFDLDKQGEWISVQMWVELEAMMPIMMETFMEYPDDVARAIASAESLERMAASIRRRVKELSAASQRT